MSEIWKLIDGQILSQAQVKYLKNWQIIHVSCLVYYNALKINLIGPAHCSEIIYKVFLQNFQLIDYCQLISMI